MRCLSLARNTEVMQKLGKSLSILSCGHHSVLTICRMVILLQLLITHINCMLVITCFTATAIILVKQSIQYTCFSAVESTWFIIATHFSFSSSTVCHVCFSSLQSSVTLSEHFFILPAKWASSEMRAVASGMVLWFSPACIAKIKDVCIPDCCFNEWDLKSIFAAFSH